MPPTSLHITGGNTKTNAIYCGHNAGQVPTAAIAAAETLTGCTFNAIETFCNPMPDWTAWENPWQFDTYGWQDWLNGAAGRQLIFAMDLVPWSETGTDTAPVPDPYLWEAKGAAGQYNTHYTALAQNMVSWGLFDNGLPLIIRLGVEANGNWEADWVGSTAQCRTAWAQTWVHLVTSMRAVNGTNFLWCWNPNAAYAVGTTDLASWYPGDSYVDIIGIDQYDQDAGNLQTAAQEGWAALAGNGSPSTTSIIAFANSHGKPIAYGEWGLVVEGTDDPAYVNGLAGTVHDNSCAFQCYFNSGTAGIIPLSSAYPQTLAAYTAQFAGEAGGSVNPGRAQAAATAPAPTTQPPAGGGPLNANTGFEDGLTGWSPNGLNTILTQSSAWAAAGTWSGLVTVSAAQTYPGLISGQHTVTPGVTYTAAGTFRSAQGGVTLQWGIRWYNPAGDYLATSFDTADLAAGTPQSLSAGYAAPAGAGNCAVFAQLEGSISGATSFAADEFSVSPPAPPQAAQVFPPAASATGQAKTVTVTAVPRIITVNPGCAPAGGTSPAPIITVLTEGEISSPPAAATGSAPTAAGTAGQPVAAQPAAGTAAAPTAGTFTQLPGVAYPGPGRAAGTAPAATATAPIRAGYTAGTGTTRPLPGGTQIAVADPAGTRWTWLGTLGHIRDLKYSFVMPGGCDKLTCTVQVPAAYRPDAFSVGNQVRAWRGGHIIWTGRLDEPAPGPDGWTLTAAGDGQRGQDFTAIYTGWPAGQPDDAINQAISRGLPWLNPGVGQPSWAWYGQQPDPGSITISELLNQITSKGTGTWYVNSQPSGRPRLTLLPIPQTPDRLLLVTTPVPRTLGAQVNRLIIRYQATPDTTGDNATAATYALTTVTNTTDIAAHQATEEYLDLSSAGVMTAAAAQAVGNNILSVYQRASYTGPFTAVHGQLMTISGSPIDPGTDQAGTVVRCVITDAGYGGEVTPAAPVIFPVAGYEWDDWHQVATLTPYQSITTSLSGLISAQQTITQPITTS